KPSAGIVALYMYAEMVRTNTRADCAKLLEDHFCMRKFELAIYKVFNIMHY
ncbi:hypothetical protein ACJX0J_027406, partial [Zea mays]